MALYLSVMASYNNVYLWLCILMWIPFCVSLEGQNVCKRLKAATDANNRVVYIKEFFCCAGYKAENNRCVECRDCTHSNCPAGFCGDGCLNQCECTINAHCHPDKCCVCNKGFTGQSCDTPCAEGYYGEKCIHTCLCSNHSTCDRFTGTCLCDDGWTGDTCTEEAYWNVNCAPNCNCQDPRCSKNGSHLSNSSTEPPLSRGAETRPQTTEIFSLIVITIIVLGLLIIILAFISVVIFISMKGKKKYRTDEAITTDATGHYDEINPYDEIPEEQLEQLEQLERILEPYYTSPLDVIKLKRTHSLPYIKPNRIRDAHIVSIPEIKYPNGSPKMHKYLSLPNLCNKDIMKAPYIELNMLKEVRHYNKLKQHSHYPTGSGYLHPYNSLLRPGIIGSGYLHPYTALKKKTEHTGTSFDSNTCVERPVSGENKSNTSVNRSISDEKKSISSIYRPVSGDNKSNTSVNRPISEENKSISSIYRPVSGKNKSNTSVNRSISDDNKSVSSIYRPVSGYNISNTSVYRLVSGDNKSNTSINRPVSGDNESVKRLVNDENEYFKRPISDDNKTNNVSQ